MKKDKEITHEDTIFQKISPVINFLNLGKIQTIYFPDKSVAWFYDRISGKDRSGNVVNFTKQELSQLKSALEDITNKIKISSAKI